MSPGDQHHAAPDTRQHTQATRSQPDPCELRQVKHPPAPLCFGR